MDRSHSHHQHHYRAQDQKRRQRQRVVKGLVALGGKQHPQVYLDL